MKRKTITALILLSGLTLGAFATQSSAQPVQAAENRYRRQDSQHRNLTAKPVLNYKGLISRVVQKHYLDKEHQVYALQLNNGNISVKKGQVKKHEVKFPKNQQLTIKNGQHTQVWDDMGNGKFLVGVTPRPHTNQRYKWTTELGRVSFSHKTYQGNDIPRLTDLNKASDDPNYSYDDLERVEAAVSPNQEYLLICSAEFAHQGKHNLHFGLYHLSDINAAFDQAENSADKSVSLSTVTPISTFHLGNAYGGPIQSIQGLAVDNNKNIYIDGECPPLKVGKTHVKYVLKKITDKKGHVEIKEVKKVIKPTYKSGLPREIIRIPWQEIDPHNWTYGKINSRSFKKWAVELEGIQIKGKKIYLTVAFHNMKDRVTQKNMLYEIAGFVA